MSDGRRNVATMPTGSTTLNVRYPVACYYCHAPLNRAPGELAWVDSQGSTNCTTTPGRAEQHHAPFSPIDWLYPGFNHQS